MSHRLAGRPRRRRRCWSAVLGLLGTQLRREFFPEVDAGAFEIYVRAASGTRIEETEKKIAQVEKFVRETARRGPADRSSPSSAWSPTCRPPTPPTPGRWTPSSRSSSPTSGTTRPRSTSTCSAPASPRDPEFSDLEFAFDAGGMIRSAMNEGKSSPINVRISGKDLPQAREIAEAIQRRVAADRRRGRRPDHPAARLSRSTSSTSTGPRSPTSG